MSKERYNGLRSWAVGYGLMVVACITIGLSFVSAASAKSRYFDDISSQASFSVRSTDQARIGHLPEEMAKLPTELVTSAIHVGTIFENQTEVTQGSGTITDYSPETGFGYGLTARHILEPLQGQIVPVSAIDISRPQYSAILYRAEGEDICVEKASHHDYAVFGFRLVGLPWGRLGINNVNDHWQDSSEDDLFALGYPQSAEFNHHIFPTANFHIKKISRNIFTGEPNFLIADIPIDIGASGAGIIRIIGGELEVIGVWEGLTPYGVIAPIDKQYSQLLATCKANLEH